MLVTAVSTVFATVCKKILRCAGELRATLSLEAKPVSVHDLLQALEDCSEASDSESKARRKALWTKLLPHLGNKQPTDLVGELAHDLGVQPITVRRWINGEYAPRPTLLKQLRNRFGVTVPLPEAATSQSDEPDQPVGFGGSYAALRTIDHFFFCLEHAKSCFVFKGLLGFHAGRSDQTRRQLVRVLTKNKDLNIYYVFPSESRAEATFGRFLQSDELSDPSIASRIRKVQIRPEDDTLGLDRSFASPFVVIYGSSARRSFRRPLDIWYELPVEALDEKSAVVDRDQRAFVFVQLPIEDAKDLWEKLNCCLEAASVAQADRDFALLA